MARRDSKQDFVEEDQNALADFRMSLDEQVEYEVQQFLMRVTRPEAPWKNFKFVLH